MAKKLSEEDATAPFWMVTMGDMNMLLLTFFVLLFSMLTLDKVKYIKLTENLKAISFTGRVERTTAAQDQTGETAARAYKAVQTNRAAESSVHQIAGHYVRLQRLAEGIALTRGTGGSRTATRRSSRG
jgi:flagellar motor protein MotB